MNILKDDGVALQKNKNGKIKDCFVVTVYYLQSFLVCLLKINIIIVHIGLLAVAAAVLVLYVVVNILSHWKILKKMNNLRLLYSILLNK